MFEDVLAQEYAKRMLSTALERDRVPFGVLLSGPQKVGKYTLAKSFARVLNCKQVGASDCLCGACKKVRGLMHSDVKFIEPNEHGRIQIEQVRSISETYAYRLFEGRYKVCVIHQADRLTQQAANAFLKVLEEPKGKATLILTTNQPKALLDTIKSRCQTVRFTLLPDDVLAQLMIMADLPHDPVVAQMMGGSFLPDVAARDLFLLKPVWVGKQPPAVDKVEELTLRQELQYIAVVLAHMIRNNLSNFREIKFRRATNQQKAGLFYQMQRSLGLLNQRVRPYLVMRYAENRIVEALQ